MARADLVADLRASLQDAGKVFQAPDEADFVRHLDKAAEALAPVRPRTEVGSLTLVVEQPNYPAPADLWRYKSSTWGSLRAQPWEKSWPGRLPEVRELAGELWFVPAPTAHQVAMLGASFTFFYYALHAVGAAAEDTTVSANDRNLLLLRAQAEAMRELAMRDSVRPVTARDGYSGQPKTGIPAALYRDFMAEFEALAGRAA